MDRLKHLALLVAFVLVAAACDSGGTPETIAAEPPSTEPGVATTLANATTTSQVGTTSVNRSDGVVGTRQALVDAMEEPIDISGQLFAVDEALVPIPAIVVSDPVLAASALADFEFWTYANATLEGWADILAVEESPAWDELRTGYANLLLRTAHFDESVGKPYEVLESRLPTSEEANQVPVAVVANAPSGSETVVLRTRIAKHTLGNPDDPEFNEQREGWQDRTFIAVVTPTAIGWRYFWQSGV